MVRECRIGGRGGGDHDLLDFLDAGENGGKLDEVGLGDAGNDFGERGLAGAGRSPEDHRGGIVAFDLHAQWLAGADQMFLPDESSSVRGRMRSASGRPPWGLESSGGMGENKFMRLQDQFTREAIW